MKVWEFMHEMRTTSAILSRDAGIRVVFEGDEAKTDGSTIYLPSLPLNEELTHEQVQAMRGFVDHESGHIKHSSMDRIMDFYQRNIANGREDLNLLHNALEDCWMQREVMKEYPGAYKNMLASHELIRAKEIAQFEELTPSRQAEIQEEYSKQTPSNAASHIVGNNPDFIHGVRNQKLQEYIADDTLAEWSKRWCELALECENSEEVITLAKTIYDMLKEDEPPEGESDESGDGEPKLEGNPEDWEPGEGDGQWDEGELPEGNEAEGEGDGKGVGESVGDSLKSLLADDEPGGGGIGGLGNKSDASSYRVWSTVDDLVYRRNNMPEKGSEQVKLAFQRDSSLYNKRRDDLTSDILIMKTKLKRALLARVQRDWDFGREQGRLDTKRLVSATLGNPSVFKQRIDRDDEDTAITLLVDLSGSMYLHDKVEVARDAVVAMMECFEGTQYKVRVSGFSNNSYAEGAETAYYENMDEEVAAYHRYERTDHIIFKDFDESLRESKGVIGNLDSCVGGNNSDYDFVLSELYALSKRPEKREVLFVLSDGNPACASDYDYSTHERLIKEAIKDASRKGVECVGIGIKDTTVRKLYENYVVVNDISDLSGAIFNKLTEILVSNRRAR